MDNICFLTDFPDDQEVKYYKEVATDASGKYHVFSGGTYICITNGEGKAVRFTSKDALTNEQIDGWVARLHQLHPHF